MIIRGLPPTHVSQIVVCGPETNETVHIISLSTTSNVAYVTHQGISAEENMQAEVTNTTISGEVDEHTDNGVNEDMF